MGLTNAKLQLRNPRKPDRQPVEVDALADSGAVFLCIPTHVQIQLELEELEKREVTLADGGKKFVPSGEINHPGRIHLKSDPFSIK